jgi:hypothetical protein
MKLSEAVKELIEVNIYEESDGIRYYCLSGLDVEAIISDIENLESQVLKWEIK